MSVTKSQRIRQFPGQHEDEVVDFVFRQHPLVMRKALIVGLLVIVVAVLPFDFPQIYSWGGLAQVIFYAMLSTFGIVLFVWFYRWVGWYYSVYVVTDRRIIAIRQRGFFARRVEEWQLNNISNVNYEISGLQAVLFGFGDITAKSYLGDISIKTVHRPADIHEQLLDAVRRGGGGSSTLANSTPNSN
jgi:hypothetical protein